MHLTSPHTRIFVAGHRGLVGSAMVRSLERAGYTDVLTRTRSELDLRDASQVAEFFEREQPDFVVLAAAKVGGILVNAEYPADFLEQNLAIQLSVLQAAHATGVGQRGRVVFLGSSCIYPKHTPQPIREEYLLTGPLEETNEAYAIAKIAGLKLAEAYHKQHGDDFFSVMPTNLYGPGDNFDLRSSHVLPALIRKFHEAKESGHTPVTIWGTGTPRREFLYSDDLGDALRFMLETPRDRLDEAAPGGFLNVGVGEDLTILELAHLVQRVVGHEGELVLDRTKPDGTPRKLMDVSRMAALGWKASTPLEEGVAEAYEWFVEQHATEV